MTIKIIHTADWHLRHKDIETAEKCLKPVITAAKDADLCIIAGDEIDRPEIRADSQVADLLLETVRAITGYCQTIICGGTPYHEGGIANILCHVTGLGKPSYVFTSPGQVTMHTKSGPLVCTVIPQPTKKWLGKDISIAESDGKIADGVGGILASYGAKAKQQMGGQIPHILIGHFSVGGAYVSETQQMIGRDIEISKQQIALAQADLVCLGHIHKAQQIGDNIFYSGSLYSLTAGEMDNKGFWLHKLDQGRWEHIFVPSGAPLRVVVDIDFTEIGDNREVIIDSLETYRDKLPFSILNMRLKIWQDQAGFVDRATIESMLAEHGLEPQELMLERIRVPRENVRAQSILQAKTLADKVAELAKYNSDETPAGVIEKANMLESTEQGVLLNELARKIAEV